MKNNNLLGVICTFALLACGVFSSHLIAGEISSKPIGKLKLDYTLKTTPLKADSVNAVLNGKTVRVSVKLNVSRYYPADSSKRAFNGVYCLSLASTDPSISYSWTCWSTFLAGAFQLLADGSGTSYMAWCVGPDLNFADVSRPNDQRVRLDEFYAKNGKYSDVVFVPVLDLIPDVRKWGVNAHFSDIVVRSVTKDQQGKWTVKISPPKSEKVYTLESDKTVELDWKLVDE